MLSESFTPRVFLASEPTDMRKSIDGLAAIVQFSFERSPFDSDALFVFCNKRRDKIKILRWDDAGFWLYYRRLERGRFPWPDAPSNSSAIAISHRQLSWLLDGLSIEQPRAHKRIEARKIA